MAQPLIACTSGTGLSRDQLEAIAANVNADCLWTDDVDALLQECSLRSFSCALVDFCLTFSFEQLRESVPANLLTLYAIDEGDVSAAFQSAAWGAVNVLEKSVQVDVALANVTAAFECERRLQELAQSKEGVSRLFFSELSPRERQVLTLSVGGRANKRIAGILDIGLRTVESDRAIILKKLKVDSFANLIKLAVERQYDASGLRRRMFHQALLEN